MRVGLVLGAGGMVGEAYHRGVLRALHHVGWDARNATALVGTSAGSIVAASLRASRGAPGVPEIAAAEPVGAPRVRSRLPGTLRSRPAARISGWVPAGRKPIEFLTEGFRERYGDSWPDRDTWVAAVRRRDGRRVMFGRPGSPICDVGSAVAASCAIPGYFRPVTIDGVQYVDGGAHSPTNADVLRHHRLDAVLVSSPMSVDPRAARPGLSLPIRLNFSRQLRGELRSLRDTAPEVLTFEPAGSLVRLMGLNMMRYQAIDEVEELAFEQACARLQQSSLPRLLDTPLHASA
ncbi:MAG TPA: patatin-like phospholipase family protein [Frankiaceae bacterium]|nr:patatin-like phospholipase family protein [Frankiaceae bacterium]